MGPAGAGNAPGGDSGELLLLQQSPLVPRGAGSEAAGAGLIPAHSVIKKKSLICCVFVREMALNVQEAVSGFGEMVHEALVNLLRGQGEKFSSKPDLEHESPLPHGLLEQGGEPSSPAVPLENFPSPSSFPSREQERAGEAPLIHHKGTTRFNDVKVKRDNLPLGKGINPRDKLLEARGWVGLSLGAFKSRLGVPLVELL